MATANETHTEDSILTKQQEIEFRKVFVELDTDKDGRLSAVEVVTAIRALSMTPTEAEAESLQQDIIENYAGLVDFEEFSIHAINFVKDYEDSEEVLRMAFQTWDKDMSGFLMASDLKHIVGTLGEVLPEDELEGFMKEANPDKGGYVNYEDLLIKLITGYRN